MSPINDSDEIKEQWIRDVRNYRYFIFYYNKQDKRILVPRGFGFGWTFNTATIAGLALTILILGPIVVLLACLIIHEVVMRLS